MMNEVQTESRGVRWLADACGLTAEGLPAPVLVSTLMLRGKTVPSLVTYLAWWLSHPDPGSTFERKTRWLRWLPKGVIAHIMIRLGYDGLLYFSEDKIIGHVFFQRHGSSLCGFSLALAREFQGRRLPTVLVLDFLAHAHQLHEITRASIGTGRNLVARRALRVLRAHEASIPLRINTDGWILFER